jgi:hypothetical protein
VLVIVLAQVGLVYAAARGSFFTWDDYPNFVFALDEGLSWRYLTRATVTIEHFTPGHRLGDWLLQTLAPLNFNAALAFLLVCLAASTVLLHRILARLSGGAWWVLVPTATFGASVVTLTAVQWWAAGLHSLPTAVLSLLAIDAWLRWSDQRRAGALALTVLAIILGSLFYVKAILVPLYLVLLRRPRRIWEWALLALPVALYLAAHVGFGYARGKALPPLSEAGAFLYLGWLRGVLPALVNVRAADTGTTAVVLAQAAFWALVAVSVWRDHRAWRGWRFLAAAFVANMAVHGWFRLNQLAADLLVYEYRYYVELAYLVPIAVVLAFPATQRRAPEPSTVALAVAAVAVHVALFTGAAAQTAATWSGYAARPWMGNAMADVQRLRALGVEPVLMDSLVSEAVAPALMAPYSYASQVFRTFAPDLRFNAADGALYVLAPDGHLQPAERRPIVDLASSWPDCAGAGSLSFAPEQPLQGQRLVLRPSLVAAPPGPVPVYADLGSGPPAAPTALVGTDGRLVDLVTPTLTALRIDVPPGTTLCVEGLEVVDVVTLGETAPPPSSRAAPASMTAPR